MATAPAPGARESSELARTVFTLTVRGESRTIAPFNLPLKEDLALAKATGGMSVESLIGDETHLGLRSLKILWWLARRAAGEKDLTLDQAWDEWPTDLDIETELEVRVDSPDPKEKDPEA